MAGILDEQVRVALLGHDADAEAILIGHVRLRRGGTTERHAVVAVVHRRGGAFTHLCRLPADPAGGRVEVRVEAILPGERWDEARALARSITGLDPVPEPCPTDPARRAA